MTFAARPWLGALLAGLSINALAGDLPKALNGRWTWVARSLSQTFSLDNIQRQGDADFSAVLTWWTANPKCTIHSAPITGHLSEEGTLSFDAKTACNVAFTAQLKPADGGWTGQATTGDNVVVELSAH